MSRKLHRKDEASPDTIGVRSIATKGLSKAYKPMPLAIGNYQQKIEFNPSKGRQRNARGGLSHDITSLKTHQVTDSGTMAKS